MIQFRNRRQQSKQLCLRLGDFSRLFLADKLDDKEREAKRALERCLATCQGFHMKWLFAELAAKGFSFCCVVCSEREDTAHEGRCIHSIPHTRNVEHGCNISNAVFESTHGSGGGAAQDEFSGRHFACPELVLETGNFDVL